MIGKTVKLTAAIGGEKLKNQNVIWSSSDDNIAAVNADGVVTAVSAGKAIIKAEAADGAAVNCEISVEHGWIDIDKGFCFCEIRNNTTTNIVIDFGNNMYVYDKSGNKIKKFNGTSWDSVGQVFLISLNYVIIIA